MVRIRCGALAVTSWGANTSTFLFVQIDLNAMEPADVPRVVIQNLNGKYAVETVTNSSELDLTIGPRYMQNEVRCSAANYLGVNTSGVLSKRSQKISHEIETNSIPRLNDFSIGDKWWYGAHYEA